VSRSPLPGRALRDSRQYSRGPVRLRFFSDLHVGSPTGVWPPLKRRSSRKLEYSQNPAQAWLWKRFQQSVKMEPQPDLVFFCGDLMDQAHRVDLDTLQEAAQFVLSQVPQPKYVLEGTPFHEELFMGVIVPGVIDGKVHDVVEKRFEGKLFNVAHHPEAGGGVIYKSTILGRTVMFAAVASQAGKARMPDVIVRGHLHHYALYQDVLSTYVQLPCFVLQDSYAKKKRFYGWRPDIGHVDIVVEKGKVLVEPHLYKYPI